MSDKSVLVSENRMLKERVEELQATIDAIRSGTVDALVQTGPDGEQVLTLNGALEPYRVMVEAMGEGALALSRDGTILYCNARFAHMVQRQPEQLVSRPLADLIDERDRTGLQALLACPADGEHHEILRLSVDGEEPVVRFMARPIPASTTERVLSVVATDLTDVIAAARSRMRLALIVESSDDAILSTDPDGVVLSWNKGAETLFGYRESEAVGQSLVTLIVPEEHRAEMEKEFADLRAGKPAKIFEAERRRRDGSLVYLQVSASPMTDDEGHVIGASIIQRDIGELKRREQALLDEQAFSNTLIQSIPDFFFLVDPEAGIERWNTRLQELLGLPAERMSGVNALAYVHEEDRARVALRLQDAVENGSASVEARLTLTNGVRDYLLTGNRVDTASGVHVIGIGLDITERKEVEDELRNSEARFRLAMAGANDGLWDWNLETDEVYYSPRWFTMLGYEPGAFPPVLDTWSTLVHPDDKEMVLQRVADYLEGRTDKADVEFRMRHKDGRDVIVNSRAFKVVDEATGKPVRLVGTHVDITERKAAEDALRLSEARLREAQQVARLGSWELDLVEDVLWWSDENYKVFGVSPDKNTYETFLATVHPDDREFVDQAYTGSVRDHTPYDIEHRLLMPDGSVKWVNERCQTYYAEDGTPLRSSGTTLDITERKHAELRLRGSLEQTIRAMAATVELRDPYTAGHQQRVADVAEAIARKMQLDDERVQGIQFAATIHDLGKINVPAEILSYPGKLDNVQRQFIQQHARDGYEILKNIEFPWPIAQTVLQHHERMDGSGYPQGLKAEDILLEARIVAVADVVEAISSHRPYRAGFGIEAALDEIRKGRGVLYDPVVADACLSLFADDGFHIPDHHFA